MADQFILFDEPYPKKRKIPFRANMDFPDAHFPPASVYDLKDAAYWVRDYWNQKNLRKRVGQAQEVD
jgi:hypothetical protein